MTMADKLLINLPFEGFYNSRYSDGIDREEEQWCEWRATELNDSDDDEMRHPEELRFDAGELAEMLFDCTDYYAAYEAVAKEYVSTFDAIAGDIIGLSVPDVRESWDWQTDGTYTTTDVPYDRASVSLEFESMTSPRFYNFETDRIFAFIPAETVEKLFTISAEDNHETLARVLMERFTDRSGFHSFYSNELSTWLEKPLRDWDHNELGSLLIAAIQVRDPSTGDRGDESLDWRVYEAFDSGNGEFYDAWSNAVDWPKFETMREERRALKLAELQADDPDYVPPYRCPETPDLFAAN